MAKVLGLATIGLAVWALVWTPLADGLAFMHGPPPAPILRTQDAQQIAAGEPLEIVLPLWSAPAGLSVRVYAASDEREIGSTAGGYRRWNVLSGTTWAAEPVTTQTLPPIEAAGDYVVSVGANWTWPGDPVWSLGDALYGFFIHVQ